MNEKEIAFKLTLDPEYINKSMKSICKDCGNNTGWKGEHYGCKLALDDKLRVKYRPEGVFHSEIYECNMYGEVIDVKIVESSMVAKFESRLESIQSTDELGTTFITDWIKANGYEQTLGTLAKLSKIYFKYMFGKKNWKRLAFK